MYKYCDSRRISELISCDETWLHYFEPIINISFANNRMSVFAKLIRSAGKLCLPQLSFLMDLWFKFQFQMVDFIEYCDVKGENILPKIDLTPSFAVFMTMHMFTSARWFQELLEKGKLVQLPPAFFTGL